MAWRFISPDYPSPLCYQVPLLIHALCAYHQWAPRQLAKGAGISLRAAWDVTTPGRLLNLNTVERVANAFHLAPGELLKLAALVPLPANRSLTVCPPPVALVLPPMAKLAPPKA